VSYLNKIFYTDVSQTKPHNDQGYHKSLFHKWQSSKINYYTRIRTSKFHDHLFHRSCRYQIFSYLVRDTWPLVSRSTCPLSEWYWLQ